MKNRKPNAVVMHLDPGGGQSGFGLSAQLVEQHFRLLEVGGIEAFGEPVVNFLEHRARLIATVLLREHSGQLNRRCQLVRLRALVASELRTYR